MPSLDSQLNHGEFKSKSELQIKKLEEVKQCRRRKQPWQFRKGCEISQPLRIFAACEFS